jgi:hypothetical protein
MGRNEPLLADVRAPWDREGWGIRQLMKPKNLWRTIRYDRRYSGFWAPASIDTWRYPRFLAELDDLCLRSLRSQGALSARELASCLNDERRFRTKPKVTGIHRISAATAHDWITLGHRRGYVVAWAGSEGAARGGGQHWRLTEQGAQAIHSRFMKAVRQVPFAPLVPLLITGGGLVAALDWLGRHPSVIVALFFCLLAGLEVAAIQFWFSRWERRQNPAVAVVAVETLRSAGRPIPAL